MENFAEVKWNFPRVVITPSKQNWGTVEETMPVSQNHMCLVVTQSCLLLINYTSLHFLVLLTLGYTSFAVLITFGSKLSLHILRIL